MIDFGIISEDFRIGSNEASLLIGIITEQFRFSEGGVSGLITDDGFFIITDDGQNILT